MNQTENDRKTCSRGHRYQGTGPCPVCWPGHYQKKNKRFIALLRGINVGGKGIIKMADLKKAVEECGFQNVSTYIQSGNIIFDSELSSKKICEKLETGLSKSFGMDLRIVVKSNEELNEILGNAPLSWKKGDDLRRYMAFTMQSINPADILKEVKPKDGVDSINIGSDIVYLSTKLSGITSSGFSKLAGKPIYKDLTIRNYNTVLKIFKLMNGE